MVKLRLEGDTSALIRPGQFADIRVPEKYLRRPISVCDWDGDSLTLVYRVLGGGTAALAALEPGAQLDLLTGLGNGYNVGLAGKRPLLLGGGAGIPPLYGLCKRLLRLGAEPVVLLGYRSAGDVYLLEEFRALGASVRVSTQDGSLGTGGVVTDLLEGLDYTFFYTCGPEPMYRAISRVMRTPGEYSFEARMGCGFGACMGCSCETLTGTKRICRDGPVMESGEVKWES
jgi:dihydroorotate dehydrogenase electron transfer subunit